MGNEVEVLAEGIALIPPMVCVILVEQYAPPGRVFAFSEGVVVVAGDRSANSCSPAHLWLRLSVANVRPSSNGCSPFSFVSVQLPLAFIMYCQYDALNKYELNTRRNRVEN